MIGKYLSVIAVSMFKFIFGPLTGGGLGLSIIETALCTTLGMMCTVVILSLLGERFRQFSLNKFRPERKLFTRRNRKIVEVWRQYGLMGVSILTPVLFSPVVGTFIVVAFGEKRQRIFIAMLGSAMFWSLVFSTAIIKFKDILPFDLEL